MPPPDTPRDLIRKGGLALILGGLLNILREIPIAMSEGVTPDNFSPHTLANIMR